ncbi:MAG TPA: CsbD family protein [Candidatus Dormibacteraeota bacterium]
MPGRQDEAKGTVKKAIGKATGNKKLANEGRTQKAVGKTKRTAGDAKEGLKGAIKGVKESTSRKGRT